MSYYYLNETLTELTKTSITVNGVLQPKVSITTAEYTRRILNTIEDLDYLSANIGVQAFPSTYPRGVVVQCTAPRETLELTVSRKNITVSSSLDFNLSDSLDIIKDWSTIEDTLEVFYNYGKQ